MKFDPAGRFAAFDPRQPSLERLELSETFCRKLREAVGGKADLLFGTHGQFTTSGAIRLGKRLEKYEPLWFEEPVPPEMPEEMAAVARAVAIPVATGERLTTKYEFARVLQTGAASILQMNLGRVGGLLEAKKIAGMAETHYAQIAPHLYCGPVVGAANLQLAACSPNFLILESILTWGGFHGQILKTPIRWEDGYVIPPTAPGLGHRARRGRGRRAPLHGEDAAPRHGRRPADWVSAPCATASSAWATSARTWPRSLVRGGFATTVYDLDREAAEPLLAAGAAWAARRASWPRAGRRGDHLHALARRRTTAVLDGPCCCRAAGRVATWIEMSTNGPEEITRARRRSPPNAASPRWRRPSPAACTARPPARSPSWSAATRRCSGRTGRPCRPWAAR